MNSIIKKQGQALPISFTEVQVTNEDLVINFGSVEPGLEEMNTVQVGDVHSSKERNSRPIKTMQYKKECV